MSWSCIQLRGDAGFSLLNWSFARAWICPVAVTVYCDNAAQIIIVRKKINGAVFKEIVPQAELCIRCGFTENFTYKLVHDSLKLAHMCRNMLGQNWRCNVLTACAFIGADSFSRS